MDLKLSASEVQLRDALAACLAGYYDFPAHLERTATAASRDDKLWARLVEGDFIARALPRAGELQQSLNNAAIVAEEFGRAVVVEPFFRSSFLAAHILFALGGDSDKQGHVAAIAEERHRFACALYEPQGRFSLEALETRAVEEGGGWRLSGRKAMVLDGADADRLLVSARTATGDLAVFLVEGGTQGIRRAPFHTIDDFAAADIELADVAASLVARGPGVEQSLRLAVDRVLIALGAEAVGAASAALDETAAYAGQRQQFGRIISQFQVVAHRLARMFIELEVLRGGMLEALASVSGPTQESALGAAGLKVLIADSGRFVVNQGVQLHGGVGTVNDYKVSHCFKRVFALETLMGNGNYYLDRYARLMS
jgi:alkylation response protein AidB-like acyl-CoA dehydrogenase